MEAARSKRVASFAFAGRIYAEASGQLVMDLNAADSEPRRRFTASHEIMHTAFPGFRREVPHVRRRCNSCGPRPRPAPWTS